MLLRALLTRLAFRISLFTAALVTAALASVSCDKMPLTAPSGTAITLVAATNVLPINGSVDITAVLIEGGQAIDEDANTTTTNGVGTPVHNGTVVTFLTTLGRIEPAEAKTSGGRVTVKLIADGRSGTATITAISGPAVETVDVSIGAAGAVRMAVTATPQALPGTGGTTTISARAEDQQGNGVAGVVVSFSSTAGTLANSTVTTNQQGVATTTLTTTQAATVTASAGGATSAITGTVAITLAPRATISIAPPASAMVAVPATFTFTPGTNTIVAGVDIDWGDGSGAELGAITGPTAVLHPFRTSGIKTVTATVTDSSGNESQVSTQVGVAPLSATGSFSPNSATAPKVGDTVLFTVSVPANALVQRYEWNFGDGETQDTTGNQVSHSYGSSGTKVVSVRIIPVGGGDSPTVLMSVDVKP